MWYIILFGGGNMLYERVLEQAKQTNRHLEDILCDNNITKREWEPSSDDSSQAYMLCTNNTSVLFLSSGLDENKKNFLTLHELGHYFIEYKESISRYMQTCDKKRSEFTADLFACLYLLQDEELYDVCIPDYLIARGCPKNTAWKVYEYILNNRFIIL